MWIGIIFYILKIMDRVWDHVDTKAKQAIQNQVDDLERRNRTAREQGNVEEMNATRAALDEIDRGLRNRANS